MKGNLKKRQFLRPRSKITVSKKVHSKRFSTYLLNFCRQRANPINRTANAILEDWCTSLHQFRIGSKSAVTVCRRGSINYVILWRGVGSWIAVLQNGNLSLYPLFVKIIYSEKATKFYEISTVDLTVNTQDKSTLGEDFEKNLWPSQNI